MFNLLKKKHTLKDGKKSIEFSKLIYIQVQSLVAIVSVYSMIIMWVTRDLTPLPYLITAVFTDSATTIGFYCAKAKVENKIKLANLYGIQLEKEDLNEN